MAESDGIVWRQVGEAALMIDPSTSFSYGAGVLTIIAVAAIAVATIIFSARWAIRSMIRSATQAVAMVDRQPSAGLSGISTSGLGRMTFSDSIRTMQFERIGSEGDPTSQGNLVREVSQKVEGTAFWVVGDLVDGRIEIACEEASIPVIRPVLVSLGFGSRGDQKDLTLGEAERIAERAAFEDAVASLAIVHMALSGQSEGLPTSVNGIEVETVSLPPLREKGEVVKRVSVRWTIAGEAA